MRLLTWNINGLRSIKTTLKSLFDSFDVDIICLQETKITRDQLDEQIAIVEGYNCYFSFSRTRSGYSGVVTVVRDSCTPIKADEGLNGVFAPLNDVTAVSCYGDRTEFTDDELRSLDKEGRAVVTQHTIINCHGEQKSLFIINVYCPRADHDNVDRLSYKLKFCKVLQLRAKELLRQGSHVLVCGDLNIPHRPIDHCDPSHQTDFDANPGRIWLCDFLRDGDSNDSRTFVDTFRYFHPTQREAFTCWRTTTGARTTNYGTRIDYIIADNLLTRTAFSESVIRPDIAGSDHCPVLATLDVACIPAKRCPSLCSRHMPEYAGKQQKLSSFFTQKVGSDDGASVTFVGRKRKTVESQKSSKAAKSSAQQTVLGSFFIKHNETATKPPRNGTKEPQATVQSADCFLPETPSSPISTANASNSTNAWRNLLKGLPKAPLCNGHKEPCVLRTVRKDGANKGRRFWVCARPEGHKSNAEARCEHFEWLKK